MIIEIELVNSSGYVKNNRIGNKVLSIHKKYICFFLNIDFFKRIRKVLKIPMLKVES
jgi:hypothetical protein